MTRLRTKIGNILIFCIVTRMQHYRMIQQILRDRLRLEMTAYDVLLHGNFKNET